MLFPWLLFLKSSSGNCTTCLTQDFQNLGTTGHPHEEAVTDKELDLSYVMGLIHMLISVSFSKLFPKHLPLGQKTPV